MSKSKRPPDILRKSHAHSDGDRRAREKAELRDEVGEAIYGAPQNDSEENAEEHPDQGKVEPSPDEPTPDEPSLDEPNADERNADERNADERS